MPCKRFNEWPDAHYRRHDFPFRNGPDVQFKCCEHRSTFKWACAVLKSTTFQLGFDLEKLLTNRTASRIGRGIERALTLGTDVAGTTLPNNPGLLAVAQVGTTHRYHRCWNWLGRHRCDVRRIGPCLPSPVHLADVKQDQKLFGRAEDL